jgi:glycosyltransferase involved in cell wall biosynthesis
MLPRLAVIVSHPIQHFAPWHRDLTRLGTVDLKVFFHCDWGIESYQDPEFGVAVQWDVPLLEGYAHEFLPIARRPERLGFWEVDNPGVGAALDKFQPDVVMVHGYARRTNWRVKAWTQRKRRPLMIYSDSNMKTEPQSWKGFLKRPIVRRFYAGVDAAFYVGDSNRAYHSFYGIPEERLFEGVYPADRCRLLGAVPDVAVARSTVRKRHGIPEDAWVLLLSGKYVPRKRPLDLVAAAVAAKSSERPIYAVLMGEGPERGAIEEFCRVHNTQRVVLTGFINQSVIPEYYAASDVLVVSSDYEPYGMIVTEAACFGLPAIVSDRIGCVGANDTARPDVNALVYPCGDVEQLQRQIERLYSDPALMQRMSAASLAIAEAHDTATAAAQLTDAVQRLKTLGPRRGASRT